MKGSEYKEIKRIIELFLRGKFAGGEFKFILYLSDNTTLTSEDLFFDRADVLKLFSKNDIEAIILNENDTRELLIEKIHSSTSIISIGGNTKKDHQSYIIDQITKILDRIHGVRKIIDIINKLSAKQRKLVVLHGLLDYSFRELSEIMRGTPETLRRKYKNALEQCAMVAKLFED